MMLHGLLDSSVYSQLFSIYLTNDYDQNLLIGRGTREEMLDAGESSIFSHLTDKVVVWEIRGNRMIVFIEDEHHKERVEEQFSNSDKWGKEPDKRPWRHSTETELYTDKYIYQVWA